MTEDAKRGTITNRMGAFVAIPMAFVNDERITNAGRCLYMLLSSYTSAKADEAVAFPAYPTIMRRLGWGSKDTVAAALRNLIDTGWIERSRRSGTSSLYTINYAGVVRKPDYHQSENQTTGSPETRRYPEVREQEVSPKPKTTRRVAGFGTVITEHTDERIAAYLTILKPEISAGNAEIIAKRIHPQTVAIWRDVLTMWAERGYNRTGFANMFEAYEKTLNQVRVKNGVHASAKGEPVVLVAESYDL